MNNQVTITVAEVTSPPPGKKMWAVYDTTGKKWLAWQDKAALMQRGASYVLTKIKTSEFKGNTLYTIEDFQMLQAAPPPGAPAPQQATQAQNPAPAQSLPPTQNEHIWVQGILQRAVQAGAVVFNESALTEASAMLRRVHQTVWGEW